MPEEIIHLTLQEVFNNAWQTFVVNKQGPSIRPRLHGAVSCCYRSPTGCKCAIGASIPDSLYRSEMDTFSAPAPTGVGVVALIRLFQDVGKLFGHIDIAALRSLQAVHDGHAADHAEDFTRNVRDGLTFFAAKWGLFVPPINTELPALPPALEPRADLPPTSS